MRNFTTQRATQRAESDRLSAKRSCTIQCVEDVCWSHILIDCGLISRRFCSPSDPFVKSTMQERRDAKAKSASLMPVAQSYFQKERSCSLQQKNQIFRISLGEYLQTSFQQMKKFCRSFGLHSQIIQK